MRHYTQRQIELFYQAALRSQHAAKADLIEAVNHGFTGGQNTIDYIKRLRGANNG